MTPGQRASALIHHLLNQSLSALDFCILWQELAAEASSLAEVDHHVRGFLEGADLGELDRALALLPEPEFERPQPLTNRPPIWLDNWEVRTTRVREVSRADLRCSQCGFEMTLSQEHPPNTEMRLPFEELECPACEEEFSRNQGRKTPQPNREP